MTYIQGRNQIEKKCYVYEGKKSIYIKTRVIGVCSLQEKTSFNTHL
jgi:hypothetical protein